MKTKEKVKEKIGKLKCLLGFHNPTYYHIDWKTLIVKCDRCEKESEEYFIGSKEL